MNLPKFTKPSRGTSKARRRGEEGQILVLFTLSIVVLMLFASIVIDLGMLRNNRQILVNAVDSAALAGGVLMPVDGCNNPQLATAACGSINNAAVTKVNNLIIATLQANYPGIVASDYTISYRCLIGIDTAAPPNPYISRDVPVVCNPRNALGHTAVNADFHGAGSTRWSICRPDLGDKCNVVYVTAAATTSYSFGRVVGVNSGSTGTVASAACNGPCGQPPTAPVDLVVLIDRTASMSDADVTATRDAANAILGVYDPALQRVAIGFLGPSETNTTCSGGGGGPAVHVNTFQGPNPIAPTSGTGANWIQSNATAAAGATSLTITKPTALVNTDVLVAAISFSGGTTNNVTAPAGWVQIGRTNTPTATNMSMISYYKVITNAGTEPASYTWAFKVAANGNPATVRAAGGLIRYSGVNNTTPINVSGGQPGTDNTNPFQPNAPTVTTTSDETALIGFFAMNNNATYSANSNGLTERFERNTGGASPSIQGANKIATNAGATGASTATASAGGEDVAQHVALNPPPFDTYGTTYPADLNRWIPIGFTGTDTDTPTLPGGVPNGHNEAYSNGQGTVSGTTSIGSAIKCFDHPGGTGTNLTTPVYMAGEYLKQYGRPNVTWGILLETDGQPSYSSTGDPNNYTCASAVAAANVAKGYTNADGQHIQVFTVGFGLDGSNDVDCPDGSGTYHSKNATKALSDMATGPDLAPIPNGTVSGCVPTENTDQDHFFCEPKTSDLTTVFQTVATQLAGIRTHLVQLDPPPNVYSISPSTGPNATVVTVSGKYFTGATSVKVAGTAVGFTFLSDTSLRITMPPGAPGSVVDIVVSNAAGTSPLNAGDKFTYS